MPAARLRSCRAAKDTHQAACKCGFATSRGSQQVSATSSRNQSLPTAAFPIWKLQHGGSAAPQRSQLRQQAALANCSRVPPARASDPVGGTKQMHGQLLSVRLKLVKFRTSDQPQTNLRVHAVTAGTCFTLVAKVTAAGAAAAALALALQAR